MFAAFTALLVICGDNVTAHQEASNGQQQVVVEDRQHIEDPFWLPPELISAAKKWVAPILGERPKAEALMEMLYQSEDRGGLGIQYSNDRTRSINDAWIERKGNCLTLTMMYVMLAKQIQINATFAESIAAVNWSRVGGLIIKEKHVVAVFSLNPQVILVADFLNKNKVRYGNYFIDKMTNERAKSLYFSNLAVEAFLANNNTCAIDNITLALDADPSSSQAWNIKGVLERISGNLVEAEKSYKTAIRKNPNDISAISNLVMLYKKQGLYEEADKWKIVEHRLRKLDPYFHAFIAYEAMEKNDYKIALKSIKKAIKIHPKDPEFFITLGHIYYSQNKINEAIIALQKAKNMVLPERVSDIDSLILDYNNVLTNPT